MYYSSWSCLFSATFIYELDTVRRVSANVPCGTYIVAWNIETCLNCNEVRVNLCYSRSKHIPALNATEMTLKTIVFAVIYSMCTHYNIIIVISRNFKLQITDGVVYSL